MRPAPTSLRHVADLELARRASARDPQALRELAERIACLPGFLRKSAQRLGLRLRAATVDDLCQETCLDLWRKLPTYRGEAKLETWACSFAHLQLRRWRSSVQRERMVAAEEGQEPMVDRDMPDDTIEVVEALIDRLERPVGAIIRMKHFEELTFEAIGARLAMSTNTAKSHYYRGLGKIRDWLKFRGEEVIG